MILTGYYVKILEGYYKGHFGIVNSFDGYCYKIKLLKKALELKFEKHEFKKVSRLIINFPTKNRIPQLGISHGN